MYQAVQLPSVSAYTYLSAMRKDSNDVSSDYVVLPGPDGSPKGSNAATGASAAGTRAILSQFIAFYFRAPIKAFFRTRFDYTGFARAINPHVQANERWSWRITTPGLLAHAIKEHVSCAIKPWPFGGVLTTLKGWSFIPNQVLPPMLANVTLVVQDVYDTTFNTNVVGS